MTEVLFGVLSDKIAKWEGSCPLLSELLPIVAAPAGPADVLPVLADSDVALAALPKPAAARGRGRGGGRAGRGRPPKASAPKPKAMGEIGSTHAQHMYWYRSRI